MTYTCKHCGKKVPALTICNCRGALIEHYLEELDRHGWTGLRELTAEIKALNSNLRVALRKNDSLQVQLAEYRDTVTHWQAENERLTAELKAKQGLLDISNEMVSLHVETSRRSLARAEKAEAELIECRQAAFENGRETERAAGYGELEY